MLKVSKSALYALIDGYTARPASGSWNGNWLPSAARLPEDRFGGCGERVGHRQEPGGTAGRPAVYRLGDGEGRPGRVVNGLAWTSVGGEMLEIETIILPGTGKIQITGQLGEVMTESAQIAVSLVRSFAEQYGIDPEFYKKNDIHIHAPEGAVPKDGPSAGVTMTTCLVSALSGMAVDHSVAMTGEITLHGRVLPIGGLREKSMAAYRRGIKTVFIPWDNQKDLEEIDEVVKEHIAFVRLSLSVKSSTGH